MENKRLKKLMKVLRTLVYITFCCNLLALLAVPMLVLLSPKGAVEAGIEGVLRFLGLAAADPEGIYIPVTVFLFLSWWGVWQTAYDAVLTVFLLVCGSCTAFILWQAVRVLEVMLRGSPFVRENALRLRRAAAGCFVISVAALCRTVWSFFYYQSLESLLTYNFLFCPLFFMGGLLFLVMSALFQQAAEMREEQELTI